MHVKRRIHGGRPVITLVLGGARSGKSKVAEQLAAKLPAPVTYVATAIVARDDPDHAAAGGDPSRPP